jgi:hypothetical protein
MQSFENIHKWLKEIETHSGGSVLKLLVGKRPCPASSFVLAPLVSCPHLGRAEYTAGSCA